MYHQRLERRLRSTRMLIVGIDASRGANKSVLVEQLSQQFVYSSFGCPPIDASFALPITRACQPKMDKEMCEMDGTREKRITTLYFVHTCHCSSCCDSSTF